MSDRTSDFNTVIPNMDLPMQQYQGVFDPAQIGTMNGVQAPVDLSNAPMPDLYGLQAGLQDQQNLPPEITQRRDPKTGQILTTIKDVPQSDMQTVGTALDFFKKSLSSFDNRIGSLQQREMQVQANPIMNVLTQLAGQMAQAKDMPGWVQGAGRANLALNPTPDALAHERLGLQKEQAGIASLLAAEQARQREEELKKEALKISDRKVSIEEKQSAENAAKAAKAEADKLEKVRLDQVEKTRDNFASAIKSGIGKFDPAVAKAELVRSGAKPSEVESALGLLNYTAGNVGDAFNAQLRSQRASLDEAAARAQTADERRQAESDRREATSQTNRYSRETMPSPKQMEGIDAVVQNLELADKAEQLRLAKKVSPIWGPIQFANPFRPAEWQQVKYVANKLKISGVGGSLGSGISNQDLNLIAEITPSGNMTEAQYNATMNMLKNLTAKSLETIMRERPNLGFWSRMEPLFQKKGMKDDYKKWMGEIYNNNVDNYPLLFGAEKSPLASKYVGRAGAPKEATASALPAGLADLKEGAMRVVNGQRYANVPGKGIIPVMEVP